MIHYVCTPIYERYGSDLRRLVEQFNRQQPDWRHLLLDNLGRSPIHTFALSVSKKHVRNLLPEFFDGVSGNIRKKIIQSSGIDDMTILHLATWAENYNYVKYLTENEQLYLLVDKPDIWGRNALHIATRSGNKDIISKLLAAGAQLDREDEFHNTPITYFLKLTLIENQKDLINDIASVAENRKYRDKHGRSILHLAIDLSDDTIVRHLIQTSAKDVQNNMGQIPLQAAIVAGREDIAMVLLEGNTPTIGSQDAEGITTLMHAYRKGFKDIIERLNGLQSTKTIEEFEKQDKQGRTVLYHALDAISDDEKNESLLPSLVNETTKTLIKKMRDASNQTPLQYALRLGLDDAGTILLNSELVDEKLYIESEEGNTLLLLACIRNCVESVKMILARWPSLINQTDTVWRITPLYQCCSLGHTEIVSILMNHEDIDPNFPVSFENWTALHLVVEEGIFEIIVYLVSCKATNIEVMDGAGQTPFQMAQHRGRYDVAELLHRHKLLKDILQFTTVSSAESKLQLEDTVQEILRGLPIESPTRGAWMSSLHPPNGILHHVLLKLIDEGAGNRFRYILRLAALTGDPTMIEQLKDQADDITEVDEDNWSYIDYGRVYGRLDTNLLERPNLKWPSPKTPSSFDLDTTLKEIVEVIPLDNAGGSSQDSRKLSMSIKFLSSCSVVRQS